MDYYTEFLKKVEKPERLIPIVSAVLATTLTAYYVKRIMSSSKKVTYNGAEEIPVPDGAMYYLGNPTFFSYALMKTHLLNFIII